MFLCHHRLSGSTMNRSDTMNESLEIAAEDCDKEFQRALKESAAQIKRGEVSSFAALRSIYEGRRR